MNNTADINKLSPLQRAVIALKEMRLKLDALERSKNEPIAIVGMSCRFPGGADSPSQFWELLRNGVDAIAEVPEDRWNIDEYYSSNLNLSGKMYTRNGAFIQNVDQFDPHFFGISAKEAASMDPQQRLLLELAWEALEYGGQSPQKLNGSKTGVFMGLFMDDYSRFNLYSGDHDRIDGYSSLGNARSVAVGRVAHFLGFQGPVMQLDTACSSSLLAVHLASHSLRSGECNMALAGGVNLILSPEASIGLSKMRALAPDGRCKTFDAAADGYGRGEGCGIVVLKRLSDAIANGDNILALVRGSAVNHDGASSGLTVPNGLAQEALISQALQNACVEPLKVSYVETHGTGTALGDPIEVRALGSVLCQGRSSEEPLFIGSVKTQVGHLESAAGIASLMKVILALQNQEIPGNLHLKQPSSHIQWDKLAVKVPTAPTKWDSQGQRLAGVSSFGISGTNVHLVVEEAPKVKSLEPQTEERPRHLLCLSALTETALVSLAQSYQTFLKSHPAASLANICFTANTGRSHFKYRLAVVAESTADLSEQLQGFAVGDSTVKFSRGKVENNRPKIVFLFAGQGSQYVGMARQLYETQPTFRKTLDRCDEILRPYLQKPLLSVLYPESNAPQLLHETAYTQPALFALEYALAQLWKSWGIVPDAVIGHSVGEYVAACVAGVFSLEDGLKLIAERGRLIQSLPQDGTMAAVFAPEAKIASLLQNHADKVSIACVNGPNNVVISGVRETVSEILEQLKLQGINAQVLQVSHAFHSPLMASILDEFEQIANALEFQKPRIPFISNVTGEILEARQVPDAAYWRQHLRGTVRFFTGMETLSKRDYDIFLEVGPSTTLLGMGKKCLPENTATWLPSLKKDSDDWMQLLATAGELYVRGTTIDWSAFDRDYQRQLIVLPTYPFQRQRYWVEKVVEVRRQKIEEALQSAPILKPKSENISRQAVVPPEWFYHWQWHSESLIESTEIATGAILIFGDRHHVGERFSELLDSRKYTTYFVTPGASFKQKDKHFTVNPAVAQDYVQLIETIKAEGLPISTVIHLWNYKQEQVSPEKLLVEDNTFNQSFWSLQWLAQAFTKQYPSNNLNLLLVTEGAYIASESDSLHNVHQSMTGTLVRVLSQENPTIQTKVVDVTPDILPQELTKILSQEIQTQATGEGIVAIRDRQRLTRSLERINVPQNHNQVSLSSGDTWLITGGSSDVGTEIALTLASETQINLVLTGRNPLPPRETWESSNHNAATTKRIQAIQQLESLGATVMYQAVDVTDSLGMEDLVKAIKLRFGSLDGVIHAAGVADHTTFKLLQKPNSTIAKVLAPKVQGTIVLDRVTRNEPLKYFVVLSSVSASKAEWGTGMADYAAANTFLDSYVVYRNQRGASGHSLALNYSLWSDRGMGALLGDATLLMVKSKGLNPLEPEPAANAFIKALAFNNSSVIHIIDAIEASVPVKQVRFTTAEKAPTKTLNIRNLVREILGQHLAISEGEIEGYQTFTELGLDSVGTVEVVQGLGKALEAELLPTLLFEYQTPDDLIDYLQEKFGYEISSVSGDDLLTNRRDAEGRDGEEVDSPQIFDEEKLAEDLEAESPNTTNDNVREQDIAIIGMACKIPGADNLEEYWNLLIEGRSAAKDVPEDRWFHQHYFSENSSKETSISKRGCFVENPFDFDPMFFGISPKEAVAMDPQQRVFLELAMKALQQAGYGGRYRTKNIGVFVGCGQNTYIEHFGNSQYYEALSQRFGDSAWFKNLENGDRQNLLNTLSQVLQPSEILPESSAGNEVNELAARVSHCLDLKGPSMAVVTACSSSLVALHIACESIRSGESKMAIVGGVNFNLSPSPFTFLKKAQALSPTGTCYPFDKRANGLILGEGAGVLIVKPLKQALADGDNIHAVIKGSAINNDGHSQGITAPNPKGQSEAIRQAYLNSGVDPETISYIETHGTGTLLGDPIEVEGMTKAFSTFTTKKGFCGIGSVKSSIGHLLSASGIVSLIKVVLAMQNGKIPQTLGFSEPNPHINFANTPFYVVGDGSKQWLRNENPLRAGVNGFGFGGTNCHVILEQSPLTANNVVKSQVKTFSPQLLFLTAHNQTALQQVAAQLYEHIANHPEQQTNQICFTQNNAQREQPLKAALLVNNRQDLLDNLKAIANNQTKSEIHTGKANPQRTTPIHLVFDENISITPEEVEILRQNFTEFNKACTDCEQYLGCGISKLTTKAYIFAVQYAWGRWLQSLELQPTSLLVEKIGVIVGACLNGMLKLEQAIKLLDSQVEPSIPQQELSSTWTCPLITPEGIFRQHQQVSANQLLNLVQNVRSLNVDNIREVISKQGVYLSLGNSPSLQQQITSLDANGTWIYPDKQQPVANSLLTTLAKLYVAGVRFNSQYLFPENLHRVVLPTYPFQRKTYRVEIITTEIEKETIPTTIPTLLPIEKLPSLSPQQRHLSHATLAEDLVKLDNNHQPNSTKLLPLEKLTPLSPEQRQLTYLVLSEEWQKLGK
ncbi:SDR family NAD(P)-dependent oxidoreductase [Desmonostoc muscorum LEGE 12446]|uniref:SDR family NAD(P)-dependent oxidoreductase n=1 Tax=Desmonostoc muscorum LEGE 12446 TaxID=1828758 RepID=A0A8J7CX39_DESMC|nr:type I polyketide synthase [Desmonostoc muscorum]MCF2149629.1 SDR family NAD(P)-dependent oxidoreductase [Desmonostoc muscorum LEGE 12446]